MLTYDFWSLELGPPCGQVSGGARAAPGAKVLAAEYFQTRDAESPLPSPAPRIPRPHPAGVPPVLPPDSLQSGPGVPARPLEPHKGRGRGWGRAAGDFRVRGGRCKGPGRPLLLWSCPGCEARRRGSDRRRKAGDRMAPAGPARRGALQDWEALPPPSPHGTLPPSIPCFPPHTPSRVCGAAEVMTSPRSPGRRGRINQAEWAVAMARILPLPRRLGICSLCAARVPSP